MSLLSVNAEILFADFIDILLFLCFCRNVCLFFKSKRPGQFLCICIFYSGIAEQQENARYTIRLPAWHQVQKQQIQKRQEKKDTQYRFLKYTSKKVLIGVLNSFLWQSDWGHLSLNLLSIYNLYKAQFGCQFIHLNAICVSVLMSEIDVDKSIVS